ncbi:MAG: type I restriction-modification enzyme R subunit C-terminal domain-containing protein, partial [Actinomycetes bacterium]
SPVNLVTEKDKEGRVYVSTYPTMMGLIDETNDGQRRFGVGHFDLVVIDEAHRSVYKKYGAIFDYFDSLLVGLTATPKDEVDRNTYGLFDLQDGVPTDSYDLNDAVRDCYLVPPKSVSVPVRFQRDGINYNDLPEADRDAWDEQEWDEDGNVPTRVEPEAVNKWLFNTDTVDKVLEHLMTNGQRVAGGDRLGKTIIFAKNHAHAMFIAERFDINYPKLKGAFARVIDFQTEYAQSLIDAFSKADEMPHIAISVDMLDTGIDVPEVVNLVFFKLVRSKTKFWQMIGRGTRLKEDLFGPGQHKEFFYIFDYCRNLEFFSQNIEAIEGNQPESLGERLFRTRLDLIGELDKQPTETGSVVEKIRELRRDVTETLRMAVNAMNIDNFIVRPKRKWVEKFRDEKSWTDLKQEDLSEASEHLAGLPSELDPEDEESKRFDLLMLKLQLTRLRADHTFTRLRDQVIKIASLLEEKAAIPMVAAQMALILDLQTDEWWQDVTVWMLEDVRKRLRDLVTLIEKKERKPIYTDFEDQIGVGTIVELPNFTTPDNYERFRAKARQFLKKNENQITVHKLRMNEPLTPIDLTELERILKESGVGTQADIEKARNENHGLGLFVRSLVGLDREAAKKAFDGFLAGKILNSSQIEFIDMIIDHLTEHGCMDAARLYESPYIDRSPQGVDGVFP